MTPTLRPALLAALLALPVAGLAQTAPLTTHAERSGFIQTGRYDEVTQCARRSRRNTRIG